MAESAMKIGSLPLAMDCHHGQFAEGTGHLLKQIELTNHQLSDSRHWVIDSPQPHRSCLRKGQRETRFHFHPEAGQSLLAFTKTEQDGASS